MNTKRKIVVTYTKGQEVGNCIFISEAGYDNRGIRVANFKCKHCGQQFVARIHIIKSKLQLSCGCVTKMLRAKKHKELGLPVIDKRVYPERTCWTKLKQRCLNPNDTRYASYGGRGIKVCERWLESFDNFFEDMGPRPSNKHSLDRIDVDGNYEPSNCRWATSEEQANNKTNNLIYTYNGKTQTLAQWIREIKTGNPNMQ